MWESKCDFMRKKLCMVGASVCARACTRVWAVCVCVCVCRDIVAEKTGEPNSPAVTVEIAVCGAGAGLCDLASSLSLSFIICQVRGLGIRSPRLMSRNQSTRALFQAGKE